MVTWPLLLDSPTGPCLFLLFSPLPTKPLRPPSEFFSLLSTLFANGRGMASPEEATGFVSHPAK